MKKIVLSLAASITLIACSGDPAGDRPAGSTQQVEVSISAFQFDPDPLEVEAGTAVTWTNEDDIDHTVTSGEQRQDSVPGVDDPGAAVPDGTFDGALPEAGTTFTFTFDETGTFAYYCAIHAGMTGTIVVS